MRSAMVRGSVRVVVLGLVASAIVIGTSQTRPAYAATLQATLVRGIDTSKWSPGSPDPSGIVYLPSRDRIEVTDSEVDETTGAGYHDVNLWQLDRTTAAVKDTGTTWTPVGFSKEPTGLGYVAGTDTLLISDDSKNHVWMEQPGGDGRFGTTDDTRTFINAGAYGSSDTEDPEFLNGHVFFLDGVTSEIYNVGPGGDAAFGTPDDTMTHFDIGHFGPSDWEGLGSDPSSGNLLVGARTAKKIYEITPAGSLVNTIDVSGITGLRFISGLAMAPASDGSGDDYWIVDRQTDNGANASENDGRLWEVTTGSTGGGDTNPPTDVTVTSPADGSTVSGTVNLVATASDDVGVTSVSFAVDGSTVGSGSFANGAWSYAWSSISVANGAHTVTATARDAANNQATSPGIGVNVSNAPGAGSFDAKIATGADDVEQRPTGKIWKGNADLDMMLDGSTAQAAVGLRFTGLQIPKGATITSASIQFWADEKRADATTLTIVAEAADNATAPTTKRNLTSRTPTLAGVQWTPPAWSTLDVPLPESKTPDLTTVLQEVVGRSGWSPGNAALFIITGSGRRVAESYESGAQYAAVLHVEYTA